MYIIIKISKKITHFLMNDVTMFDVRSYLDGEIQPGFFNVLEKVK